ncbi:MAG TPA: dipicolinate synthase subunit B [Clostridiales bacterium]|nr:dipicolinate synthase subunit B [Clostridia bacterium]MDD4679928.1 dipicolinate synthase subunit B [Clostridia bacterium]HCS75763.1 dipicolinate synthase subunit B [Clostridiales bacterium]
MLLKGIKIGFCVTASHCTFEKTLGQLEKLKEQGANLYPIFSFNTATANTRFTSAKDFRDKVEEITGRYVVDTIVEAEPFGPIKKMDLMIVAPCTGNTLAKLVNAITDTPVLMAAKAHLRNQRPLLLAIATNDGLGNNAKNVGMIINTKNVFMIPFYQDDPINKPNSLTADLDRLLDASLMALKKIQIQPVIIEKKRL